MLIPGELPLGELVPVRIDGAMTYDLTGQPVFGDEAGEVFSGSVYSRSVSSGQNGAAIPLAVLPVIE